MQGHLAYKRLSVFFARVTEGKKCKGLSLCEALHLRRTDHRCSQAHYVDSERASSAEKEE